MWLGQDLGAKASCIQEDNVEEGMDFSAMPIYLLF
jgi:hypothetical protein